jgi:hypothetical protein
VTSAELVSLLQDLYRDKLAIRGRHVAGAQRISNYDFNNTYQYVINREDAQIAWLHTAIEDLGATVPETVPSLDVPQRKGAAGERAIVADDARLAHEFVERWTPRAAAMTHARHRRMLEVILGETLEQHRFFDEMVRGRNDLLGRRRANVGTGGGVLPTRWVE